MRPATWIVSSKLALLLVALLLASCATTRKYYGYDQATLDACKKQRDRESCVSYGRFAKSSDEAAAREVFAIACDMNDLYSCGEIGVFELNRNNYEEANRWLRRSQGSNPDNIYGGFDRFRLYYALTLMRLGKIQLAQQIAYHFQSAMENECDYNNRRNPDCLDYRQQLERMIKRINQAQTKEGIAFEAALDAASLGWNEDRVKKVVAAKGPYLGQKDPKNETPADWARRNKKTKLLADIDAIASRRAIQMLPNDGVDRSVLVKTMEEYSKKKFCKYATGFSRTVQIGAKTMEVPYLVTTLCFREYRGNCEIGYWMGTDEFYSLNGKEVKPSPVSTSKGIGCTRDDILKALNTPAGAYVFDGPKTISVREIFSSSEMAIGKTDYEPRLFYDELGVGPVN